MLLDLLKTQGLRSARSYLQRADEQLRDGERSTSRFLKKQVVHNFRQSVQTLQECHPKAGIVRQLVEEHLKNPNERILIFSEYRDTVEHLVEDLNQIPGAIVDRFIGQSKRGKRRDDAETATQAIGTFSKRGDERSCCDLCWRRRVWMYLLHPWSSSTSLFKCNPSNPAKRSNGTGQRSGSVHVLVANDTRDVHVLHASRNREKRMHNVLARMRLEIPVGSYEVRKEGKLLEFEIVDGDSSRPALEFLKEERLRLKSIEEEMKVDASEKNAETSSNDSRKPQRCTLALVHKKVCSNLKRMRSIHGSPILDGRDINRQ